MDWVYGLMSVIGYLYLNNLYETPRKAVRIDGVIWWANKATNIPDVKAGQYHHSLKAFLERYVI